MGNVSTTQLREKESETLFHRIFYVVFGKPSIRFVRDDIEGPLIFDMHLETEDDETGIEHAQTLQLPNAVPARQDFLLSPCKPGTNREGYQLTFDLSLEEEDVDDKDDNTGSSQSEEKSEQTDSASPQGDSSKRSRLRFPRYVSVVAGITVCYLPGKGVQLKQAEESQSTPIVLECRNVTSMEMATRVPIHLDQLCKTSYITNEEMLGMPAPEGDAATTAAQEGRRIRNAPLCIAVRVTCNGAMSSITGKGKRKGKGKEKEKGKKGKGGKKGRQAALPASAAEGTQERGSGGGGGWVNEMHASSALTAEEQEEGRGEGGSNERGSAADGESKASKSKSGETERTKKKKNTFDVMLFTFLDFPADAYELKDVPLTELGQVAEGALPPLHFKGHVVKQLLQVGREVYELEDIFDLAANDADYAVVGDDDEDGDVCVICLTSPKNTIILPCRHMCLCYECAAQLRLSTNKCPICRCDIARVMTI